MDGSPHGGLYGECVTPIGSPEAAGELAGLPREATVGMAQMLTAELTAKIGPRHAKSPAGERVGNWHGTTTGQSGHSASVSRSLRESANWAAAASRATRSASCSTIH